MVKVNEIFCSLQGEGYHTGTASVFVRLSSCNLRCHFCDTHHEQGTMMSLQQIADTVNQWPNVPLLVLTGGEPSLWIDEAFIASLKSLTGKYITIETNGTRPLPRGIDWITFSPKTAFTGGDLVPTILTQCDELKVVYTGQDLSQYDYIEAKYRYLQPCYVDNPDERQHNLKACVEAVLSHPTWRLSLQTHRILGIR